MAEMTLQMADGSSRSITVDDAIKSMDPAAQQAFANHARDQIAKQTAPAQADQPATPNNGYANDLGSGASGLEHAVRSTARLADQLPDGFPGKQTVSDFGHGAQALPQPANYQSAGGRFTEALRGGDYGTALSTLPHAAVQALPGMLPGIAAGAVAGPVGAAAAITAQNAGESIEARQANNGNATPSTGDIVGGGLTALGTGIIGAGGLNPSRIMPSIGRLGAVGQAAAGIASEGVAGAANSIVGQAGTSLGTTKGLSIDPAEVGSAAIQQGAARGVTLSHGAIRDGLVQPLSDNLMSRTVEQPATHTDAQSIIRTNDAFNAATEVAKASRGDTAPTAVINSMKSQSVIDIGEYARQLRDTGAIDPALYRTIRATTNQALRHNNTAAEGGLGDTATLLDDIKESGLPSGVVDPLVNKIRDLDTLSDGSFLKNQVGPFQKIGGLFGQGLTLGGAVLSHDPYAIMGAVAGKGISGKLGSALGGAVDSFMGTATPSLPLRAMAAKRYLDRTGVVADDGVGSLGDASSALSDVSGISDRGQMMTKLAQIHADMADRQAVGNPARDPVPVNTPLPDMTGGAPQSPTQAPPAPSSAPPVVAPPAAPQASIDPSQAALTGWPKYVSHRSGSSLDEVHAALDAAAADGHYTPDQVSSLKADSGGRDRAQVSMIQRYLGSNRIGMPGENFTGLPGDVGPKTRGPIVDPVKYGHAVDQYTTHAEAKLALADGYPDIQGAIRNAQHEASGAAKVSDAEAFLGHLVATGAPQAKIDLARSLLSGPLLRSKVS